MDEVNPMQVFVVVLDNSILRSAILLFVKGGPPNKSLVFARLTSDAVAVVFVLRCRD